MNLNVSSEEAREYALKYPEDNNYSYYLPSLNIANVAKYKENQFYNPELHNQLSHILHAITKEDPVAGNVVIKKYLNNFGTIDPIFDLIEVGSDGINDLFILEKLREGDLLWVDSVKDIFDQMVVFNNLRKEIPNLQYTYAFFEGKELKIDMKNVVGWSKGDPKNNFMFCLRENPGKTFEDSLLDLSISDLLLIIAQIFLTFGEIEKVIEGNNINFMIYAIYVRKLPSFVNIRYKNLNVVLSTDVIAVIRPLRGVGGSSIGSKISGFFNAAFTAKKKKENERHHPDLNLKMKYMESVDLYYMFSSLKTWLTFGKHMVEFKPNFKADYKKSYPSGPNIFDYLSVYKNQVIFGCESLPCEKEESLLQIAPNDIVFKDILELYLYLKCGGIIRQEEIGYEKRIHFRGLTILFVEELKGGVSDIGTLLRSIQMPVFRAVFNPVVSQQINDEVTFLDYFKELKNEHIKFTKAKDLYDFWKDYLNIFLHVAKELKQEVSQTKEECVSILFPIPEYLKIIGNAFKTTLTGITQQQLPFALGDKEETVWIKNYIPSD